MSSSGAGFGVKRAGRHASGKRPNYLGQTLPILLAGTMALTLIPTSASARPAGDSAKDLKPVKLPKSANTQLKSMVKDAMAASSKVGAISAASASLATVPTSYKVKAGDTVSGIAARFGLKTAEVLTINGLSWTTLIFPGQILRLTAAATPSPTPAPSTPAPTTPVPATPVSAVTYKVVSGDTVSGIASRHGVSTQSVLDANGLKWTSIIYPGQLLRIPGSSSAQPATPPATSTPPAANGDSGTLDATPVSSVTPITPPTASPAPPPAPTPAPPPPAEPTYYIYRIVSGDTITGIASKFGVSIQSILTANGLSRSSIIYAGATLRIPGVSSVPAESGSGIYILSAEMEANARTIIQVGRSLGVSDYGIIIALSAAAQESTLRNLNYGDLDSVGLFQQRPSTGWGTPAQLTDPVYASRLFFGGPSNPNKGKTRGLLDISGWQNMTVTQAAQAVQISAYPNAYAKWEASARAWLSQLG